MDVLPVTRPTSSGIPLARPILEWDRSWYVPIVHIDGVPGSGKTSLGRQLNSIPHLAILDMDDIYDQNGRLLLESRDSPDTECMDETKHPDMGVFLERLQTRNVRSLRTYIDDVHTHAYQSGVQLIVLIGIVIDVRSIATYRIFLDLPTREIWRRLNRRNLSSLVQNQVAIERSLSDSTLSPRQVAFRLLFEYQVRCSFLTEESDVRDMKTRMVTDAQDSGYLFVDSDSALLMVAKLITSPTPPSISHVYTQPRISWLDQIQREKNPATLALAYVVSDVWPASSVETVAECVVVAPTNPTQMETPSET